MPIKTDRAVAVNVLIEVLETGAYANIALRKALGESGLTPQSRSFVTDLVNETLRNLIQIDHTIGQYSKTPLEKMKPLVVALLRISVCQINHMEKIPDRAAVDEAVKLAKKYGLTNLSGFVNGILRNISRGKESKKENQKENSQDQDAEKNLALTYSYPNWLFSRLQTWLGPEGAAHFCAISHQPPPVIILPNLHKISTEALLALLQGEGVTATVLEEGQPFISLKKAGDISQLKGFKAGLFFVMDPGAYQATLALDAKPGQTIMDLCAAPGGKTFALASQMENTGNILAYDIYDHRLLLVKQTAKRLGLANITTQVKDSTLFDPTLVETADAILVDAPCTGFGTIRKRPEIKYNRHPDDIIDMAATQKSILSVAARYLKTGGRLVYCTCTITPEENTENINAFLQQRPHFTLVNQQQLMPTQNNDAFYIATLVKGAQ